MKRWPTRLVVPLILALLPGTVTAGGAREQGSDPDRVPFAERFSRLSWDDIVNEAAGQDVYWYMWGGSDSINGFVQGYVADRLANQGLDLLDVYRFVEPSNILSLITLEPCGVNRVVP